MRGVLNGAHMRSTAYAARVIDAGDDHKPKFFPTWGPKFIALIGKLPVTLASRSIHIEMRRKTAGEAVQPLRGDRLDHLTPLCRQAARWSTDNSIKLRAIEPEVPPEIHGRAADNWRPLLAIAEAADGEWPERARQIAIKFGGRRDEQTSGVMLLEDIRRIFDEGNIERISSQELVTKLAEMEGRPWAEFRNSKPITPTQLANLLTAFQIVPNNVRIGTKTPKGYKLEQFQDAFARYTADFAATTPQPSKTADFGPVEAATRSTGVAAKNCDKPSNSAACGGVAASNPFDGQDGRSAPQHCAVCGNPDLPGDPLGPFGIDPYSWLHQRCWLEWRSQKSTGSAAHDGAAGDLHDRPQ
jgi:putative DNA primase/helicase